MAKDTVPISIQYLQVSLFDNSLMGWVTLLQKILGPHGQNDDPYLSDYNIYEMYITSSSK